MDNFEKAGFRRLSPDQLGEIGFEPFGKIGKQWFLVTAGDESGFNTMTASWGFAGVMWNKNSFITVIRPQRYTKEFLDRSGCFTASFLPGEYRKELSFCGSRSGRDVDKIKETGLTPIFGEGVTAFEQAELILVCKKQYALPLSSEGFIDPALDQANYAAGDYHTQYISEIVAAYVKD